MGEIIEVDVAGGASTPLTTGNADQGPSWSPDASQILFRRGTNQASDIYLMNADGTNEESVFHSEGYASEPVWTAQ